MKGRFEVITAENPREVKIFARYEDIPDNIIAVSYTHLTLPTKRIV